MDMPSGENPLTGLGQRLREARHRLGLTQDDVAQPEFTKSYVSAVERGKARPSLKALELMSRRLGIPMPELLAVAPEAVETIDLAALAEDVEYQLDGARRAIDTGQGSEALRLIAVAEETAGDALDDLGAATRYRLSYLKALAYLRAGEAGAAQRELTQTLDLAAELDDGGEAAERVRNLIGGAYCEQNLPQLALEYHTRGVQAIQAGVVKDPNLQLLIYSNLANDYWALGDAQRAVAFYQEALKLLDRVGNMERQSGIYWGLSVAYKALGDVARAALYAQRAIGIYEAMANQTAAAQMSVNLAELLIDRGDYPAADAALARARPLLEAGGNPLYLSALYQRYAALELARGRQAEAADYSARGVQLSEAVYQAQAGQGDPAARSHMLRTYIRALRMAGRVAEAQGDPATADARFTTALDLARDAELWEAAADLAYAYAELLTARGAHEQAGTYYRQAWRHRPSPRS
jgi:transcriptional regulator with XRE-family HTH domain